MEERLGLGLTDRTICFLGPRRASLDLEGGDPLLRGNWVSSRADGLIMKGGDEVVFL